MKLVLKLDLKDGRGERSMTTNMFAITQWEQIENRKVTDGKGIGFSDMCCWAHILAQLSGDSVPATWREWVKQHPDMDLSAEDVTDPNPTVAAPSDDN